MKQPVKSVLLKYYYELSTLALHPLFISYVHDMLIGLKHFMFQLHLFSEALGHFLICSLEFSLSTMLSFKCAVDFSSNKQLEQTSSCHSTDVLQKRSQKSCRLDFYSIEDKEICLETRYLAISSILFFFFFLCS